MARHASTRLFAAVATLVFLLAGAPSARCGPETLALFSLRPTNMDAMGYDGEIVFSLTAALESWGGVEVMPRREMEERLYQEGRVQGDNPEAVADAGRILGVSHVLFGRVTKTGAEIAAVLQLMDIRSGRVVRSWNRAFAGREALLAGMPPLAEAIAAAVAGDRTGGRRPPSAGASEDPAGASPRVEDFRAEAVEGGVRVSWTITGRQPAGKIHVYRSDTEEGPFQFLGSVAENRFFDRQVSAGRTYAYRLTLAREDGTQVPIPRTAEVRFSGKPEAAAPLILDASAGVRWAEIRFVPSLRNEKSGLAAQRYHVYRSEAERPDEWERVHTAEAGSRSQFDVGYTVLDRQGLEDGTTYAYAVAGEDAEGGESRRSDHRRVTTAPRPVLSVAEQGRLRSVRLSWGAVQGADGYRLYRSADGGEAWKRVMTVRGGDRTSAVDDSGLEDGRRYAYRMTAYDDRGETGPSTSVAAETKPPPPAPAGLSASAGGVKSVHLRWQPLDDPDVKGYAVYRASGAGDAFERIARVTGAAGYLDKGSGFTPLEDGSAYKYAVAAYNRYDAEGERAGPVTGRTKPRPAPIAGLTAEPGGDRIEVRWETGPEADIEVQVLSRSRNEGFWGELERLPAGRGAYADTDIEPGTGYRYRVVVIDADGLQSDPAESEPVKVP